MKKTILRAFEDMTFDVNTPQFIKEAAENCEGGMYAICWTIFKQLIGAVAQRAVELQDPVLDALMIKLNLYEMPNKERRPTIKKLEAKYKELMNNPTIEIKEVFDNMDPYQKAEFMQRNMEWARNCDLVNELKIRGL